jgi:hypothetical protein
VDGISIYFLRVVKLLNAEIMLLIKVERGCGKVLICSSLAVKLEMSATEHTTQRTCWWKK